MSAHEEWKLLDKNSPVKDLVELNGFAIRCGNFVVELKLLRGVLCEINRPGWRESVSDGFCCWFWRRRIML
jgi:hypothetical protein